ncbi:hypothetical protein FIV42_17895 [Persicimonas caeni]|uniref:DUF3221 domain-containing protein n=1 Tax=Persicimonas caeni TaxID=2292766 RepID=A0A4Y6PWM9_PERCE|nr:hypothetical protein [Persicimonas caeni]QDG52539.1 hypothetical protein FIV42_17895 [Persicimonas caeni]QED33761.1 hypothetical protein FRD00_17890 [Persicimonas caeni]
MSYRSTMSKRLVNMFAVVLAASFAWAGCSHEKEYVDDEGKTTGEIEVSEDETEYEIEKELPEKESRATGEKEIETEHGEVEIEVEEDEVEVEGYREYPEGENPAYTGGSGEEDVQIELGQPKPSQAISVVSVYAAPVDFIGATVVGKAEVNKVISDRGFWINHNGERIFAVVREDIPSNEMIDISKGEQLKFGGIVVDGDDWKKLAGDLEPKTRQTLEEQPYFVAVYWDDIEKVGQTSTN